MRPETKRAIQRCIELNIPFAYIMMPGEVEPRFYASMTVDTCHHDSGADGFLIRKFGIRPSEAPMLIRPAMSTADVLALDDAGRCPSTDVTPQPVSTDYADYSRQCSAIIQDLRLNGGKTVLSRIIAVSSSRQFTDVLVDYFDAFPYTCRFAYFTPQTGLWFGASPELLLDYAKSTQMLRTMSLAGTRPVSVDSIPWDDKNIDEHRMVTDYMQDTLRDCGLAPEIYDSTPLRFGAIEHLCDRIECHGDINPVDVVDILSPTPALCGWPKERAYRQIIANEEFDRHCYGGWIGVADRGRFIAYVNLRSAMVDIPVNLYNLYVGGGITALSEVQTEWDETQRKAARLREIITGKRDNAYD